MLSEPGKPTTSPSPIIRGEFLHTKTLESHSAEADAVYP